MQSVHNFISLHMFRSVAPVIIHVVCWLVFLSLPLVFISGAPGERNISAKLFSQSYLLFYGIYIILFYLNTYLLIPSLYLKKKYLYYFGVILALFACVYFIRPFERLMQSRGPMPREMHRPPPRPDGHMKHRRGPGPQRFDILSIVLFVMVCSVGMALRIMRQWRLSEQRAMQAEAGKAKAELSFLKAQINPHFLFNTLNNLYSMALNQHAHTAASILKLSNIMRYVTDEIHEDFVPLQSEVDCISDYIDLQRLRLNEKVQVDFTCSGDLANASVAPLIFMSFIENIFKHGFSNHEFSPITIRIVSEEKSIVFFSQNKIFTRNQQKERNGVGISNTRQRLEHLYPNKYLLMIDTANSVFTVQLTLLN
jgi:two-component system LytT family sensor kinase